MDIQKLILEQYAKVLEEDVIKPAPDAIVFPEPSAASFIYQLSQQFSVEPPVNVKVM